MSDGRSTGNPGEPKAASSMVVTCWGTRGSIPTPGPETVRYGGNTPCVEVRCGGRLLIFDAGTGIRRLGHHLADRTGAVEADLFLTHFHWDHIQGFPFFEPLWDGRTKVRVHGPRRSGAALRAVLARLLEPVYFPLPVAELDPRLEFLPTAPLIEDGELEIAAMALRHPNGAVGYRVRRGDASVAYLPDNELVGGRYRVPANWYDELVRFLDGVQLLIHDAMYTDAEYASKEGWGHSTHAQALRLADDCGAGTLVFFHHEPGRSDDELDRLVRDAGSRARVRAAAEGEALEIATEGAEGRSGEGPVIGLGPHHPG